MPKNENFFVSTYTNMRIEGSMKYSHSTEFRDEGETECLCAFLCMDGGPPKVDVHPRKLLFLRRVKAIIKTLNVAISWKENVLVSRISYSLLRISVDILREEIDGASVWVALVQPEMRARTAAEGHEPNHRA